MEGLHVLPVLLQQGDEEVHGQVHVLSQLLLSHLHVADGDVEAENLLHLELDGGLEVEHLGLDVIIVGDEGGELASLSRSWCWDLMCLDIDHHHMPIVIVAENVNDMHIENPP